MFTSRLQSLAEVRETAMKVLDCVTSHDIFLYLAKHDGHRVVVIADRIRYWISYPDNIQLQTVAVKVVSNLSSIPISAITVLQDSTSDKVIQVINANKLSSLDDADARKLVMTCLTAAERLLNDCTENQERFVQMHADELIRELGDSEYPAIKEGAVNIMKVFPSSAGRFASSNTDQLTSVLPEELASSVNNETAAVEEVVLPESENDPSVATRQYVLDEVLPLASNEQCELRMDEMDEMSLDGMSRMLCAFINTNGAEILYGILLRTEVVTNVKTLNLRPRLALSSYLRVGF